MPKKPRPPRRPRAAQVVRLAPEAARGAPPPATEASDRCSFCGRGPEDYRAAVRGPAGIICDACLARASAITDPGPAGH
ncbi:MAG: hypothetical protein H6977_02585 [Gammaproteobacteria bacterium]|nr:hypothetical protein [Gammaproteobacteria bacterium]MCP5198872.1 hypothetical protein [Gammaproteobacteria bacterium]